MAQYYSDIYQRFWRITALLSLLLATMGLVPTAFGLTRAELYQTVVPLADRSEAAQSAAFQAAMRVVVVRVTGRRSADDEAAFATLVSNSRRYVQQFRTAPDSKLWVSFDGPAIERWLTQNGQPLWGYERPSTFVWMDVQGGGVVTADNAASELKTSIDAAAAVRGIPLLWPTAADVQRGRGDTSSLSMVTDISRARGADALLIGHASAATAAANIRWTHVYKDRSSDFTGTLEGVNRAADTYAGLFAANGALVPVDIEVSGIGDLKDYASVQGYLESQTFISHVTVLDLAGDLVKFRLTARGGAESLQKALSLSGKLQNLPAGDGGLQRFQLRR